MASRSTGLVGLSQALGRVVAAALFWVSLALTVGVAAWLTLVSVQMARRQRDVAVAGGVR